MKPITGIYQWNGEARNLSAVALISEDHISVQSAEGEHLNQCLNEQAQFSDAIPGLPVDLIFTNNDRFIPDDPQFRWSAQKSHQRLPEILERHWLTVMVALILAPGFVWLMINKVIPGASGVVVPLIPDSVVAELSEQTLAVIDKIHLDESQLSSKQQQAITEQWNQVLRKLELPPDQFTLKFRSFSAGPNAFALPDGTVIVTDEIVELTEDKPEVLTSVLLHEIGHVHHQHGMKLATQSVATSVLFAIIFGDVEGAGEIVLGTGTALMQSAFSRDMESEADAYAFKQLTTLGMSPELFAEAMERLEQAHHGEHSDNEDSVFNYFSSHPNTAARIKKARNYQR